MSWKSSSSYRRNVTTAIAVRGGREGIILLTAAPSPASGLRIYAHPELFLVKYIEKNPNRMMWRRPGHRHHKELNFIGRNTWWIHYRTVDILEQFLPVGGARGVGYRVF